MKITSVTTTHKETKLLLDDEDIMTALRAAKMIPDDAQDGYLYVVMSGVSAYIGSDVDLTVTYVQRTQSSSDGEVQS